MRFATFLIVFVLSGFAAAQPLVSYAPVPGMQLIGVNNPEQLFNGDCGDNNLGNTVIYRETLSPGAYRNWFQHSNKTGGSLGYAIAFTNPGPNPVRVGALGEGFTASLNGGLPFVLAAVPGSRTSILLNPGDIGYLFRRDGAVPNGSSFSGVLDFLFKGGPLVVENVAYRNFARLTGTRTYQGYVVRTEPNGQNTARVYKGRALNASVATPTLAFTINNATPIGPLSVQSRDYNLTTQTYGSPVTRAYWISNIGPAQNAQGVTSDMRAWWTPGWGWIDPLTRSDATQNYPNLGNWGVMNVVNVSVTNDGTTLRTVSYNLTPPGNAPIAYFNGGPGSHTIVGGNVSFAINTVSVPAGTTVTFQTSWVLGGPGFGAIRNSVNVLNAGP